MTRRRDITARQGDALVLGAPRSRRATSPRATSRRRRTPAVVLELRNRTLLRLSVRDLDDARAVLSAVGQDPSAAPHPLLEHKRIFHQP